MGADTPESTPVLMDQAAKAPSHARPTCEVQNALFAKFFIPTWAPSMSSKAVKFQHLAAFFIGKSTEIQTFP